MCSYIFLFTLTLQMINLYKMYKYMKIYEDAFKAHKRHLTEKNQHEHTGLNLLGFIIHIKCVFMSWFEFVKWKWKCRQRSEHSIIIRCRQQQVQDHRSSSWKRSYTSLMELLLLTDMDHCRSLQTDQLIWPSGLSNTYEV